MDQSVKPWRTWVVLRLKPRGRRSEKASEEKCVFLCTCNHVNPTRADTHAWEGVQTCRFLLIGQRLGGVQTGQPHAGDACASRPRTPQGQVNNFAHITDVNHLATVTLYAGQMSK